MAKTLNKTNIILGNTILPGDVSQSIDAFTGQEEYDIFLSGSFSLTGSLYLDNIPTSSTSVNLLTIDPITNQVQQTSSFNPIDPSTFLIDAEGQLNQIEFTQADGTQFTASLQIDNIKQQEFLPSGLISTSTHPTKFISGFIEYPGNNPEIDSERFTILAGKTLGIDAFITVSPLFEPSSSPSPIIGAREILANGAIKFFREGTLAAGDKYMFIGTVII